MAGRRTALTGVLVLALAGLGAVQLVGSAPVARATGLIAFPGCDQLLEHYREQLREHGAPGDLLPSVSMLTFQLSAGDASFGRAEGLTSQAVGPGETGTNVQEQGVDEPDVAKLRDGRVVTVAGGRLQVVSAERTPRLLGSVTVRGSGDQSELLLVGDRALVVGQDYRGRFGGTGSAPGGRAELEDSATSDLAGEGPTTTLTLVDLSEDRPKVLDSADYDGGYVSARLVGGTVRVVTSHLPRVDWTYPSSGGKRAANEARAANERAIAGLRVEDVLPRRIEGTASASEPVRAVDCSDVAYAPGSRGASTLLVTTLRPGSGLSPTDSTGVTTQGDLVYAADDRMYVATSRWNVLRPAEQMGRPLPVEPDGAAGSSVTGVPAESGVATELHAFDTSSGDTTEYVGSGSVRGHLLNRWSLSRHEGTLRVATTLPQSQWDASESMVVKLEERGGALVETGRVAGLGRTEEIKAVRYFGDVAAVVTFRQTDPLYLLDLAGKPRVLGELKIPGFSTYLHPIGDGLLLGLGLDADGGGRVTGGQAVRLRRPRPRETQDRRPAVARRRVVERVRRLACVQLRPVAAPRAVRLQGPHLGGRCDGRGDGRSARRSPRGGAADDGQRLRRPRPGGRGRVVRRERRPRGRGRPGDDDGHRNRPAGSMTRDGFTEAAAEPARRP